MGRQNTYANPFILERADPFMIKADDGWYYFTASYPMKRGDDPEGYDRVILRRSKTVDGLREAEEITIWQADEKTHTHRFIWAPELHYIGGTWYIFYAGSSDPKNNWAFDCNVLVCDSRDPYTGNWTEKGKFQKTEGDIFSLDAKPVLLQKKKKSTSRKLRLQSSMKSVYRNWKESLD